LRLGLIERDAVIAVVDARNHVAGGDMLVVSDRNGGDVPGDLGGERGLPGRDESVVSGLEALRIVEINVAAAQDGREKHRSDGKDHRAALEEARPGFFAGRLRLFFLGLRRPFDPFAGVLMSHGSPRLDLSVQGLGVRPAGHGRDKRRAFNLLQRVRATFQNVIFEHDCRSSISAGPVALKRNVTVSFLSDE
jgi:hypothetical protein